MSIFKRCVSLLLAAVLAIGIIPPVAVYANETEPTVALVSEEIAAVEETTIPSESEETVAPSETEAVPEETEVVETTEATVTTEPVEETEPAETTEATEEMLPVETVPEEPMERVTSFLELTEDVVITTWVQKDYGFDLIENAYADYQEQRLARIQQSSTVAANTAALPTPQNVRWDRDTYGMLTMTFPKSVNLSQVEIDVMIYKDGQFYEGGSWWLEGTVGAGEQVMLDFVPRINASGTYTATVQLLNRYSNSGSGIASSDSWPFTLPSQRLSTPNNLRWVNGVANWNAVSNARGYYVHWNSAYGSVSGTWFYSLDDGSVSTDCGIPTENSGLTKFTVQALADLKYYKHSYESGWSGSYLAGGSVMPPKTSEFKYKSEFTKKTQTASYTYNEAWFDTPSTNGYNHDLATMSLSMAMSAFGVGSSNRGKNIKDLFDQLGFSYTDSSIKYDKPTRDSIGYAIGSKLVTSANGTYMLVAVAIRGGGYEAEWASNAKVGTASSHQGFDEAAGKVTDALQNYLRINNYNCPVKVWITGYSRGAAVTNIAAQRINAGIKMNYYPGLKADGLYAYCFECPRTVQTNSPTYSVEYKNIYNIVNHADIVTKVAMEDWNYSRYGTNYYLPSPELSSKYSGAEKVLKKEYIKLLTGVVSNPSGTVADAIVQIKNQGEFTNDVADAAASFFSDPVTYTVGYQDTVQDLIVSVMTSEDVKLGTLVDAFLEGIPAFVILHPFITSKLALNGETIMNAHYPELCLAWMKALDESSITKVDARNRRLVLNCPIDISVYDSTGALVAQITENEAQEIDGSYIGAYVDENGQKIVILPIDEEYTVKVNATDDGTMSYQIQDVDIDQNAVTHLVSFHDVPIAQGDELTADVQNITAESADYTLVDPSGTTIEADLELAGNIPTYTVFVSQEGEGIVTGGGKFIIGEYAQLTAEDAERSVFLGWFENDELVSEENSIRFRVEEDRNLTAVFLSTDVTMELDREYLAIEYTSEETITEELDLTVTPEQWMEFVTWSVEDGDAISVDQAGIITVLKPGMAYAVATASFKGHIFTARCRVDVTEDDIAEDLQEYFGINGILLGTAGVTTELYSNTYAELTVIPLLSQNFESQSASIDQEKPKNNGVAVTGARFTDEAVHNLFDLVVKDDRTLLVVPTEAARTGTVKTSYKSTITVAVDGGEFVTVNSLKLTVKKTLPKLKAATVALNSFYSGNVAEIQISGGQVARLWSAESEKFPDWLLLSDNVLSLKPNAPRTGSAKLSLLADVEGYTVPVAVTVPVKVSYAAPRLKLSATTVTLQDDFSRTQGVTLKLMPNSKKQTLDELHVENISAPEGYRIDSFDDSGGNFILIPETAPEAGTILLKAKIAGADELIDLKLTVKISPVKIKLSKSNITLGWAAPYNESISLTVSPADYNLTAPVIRITDKSGKNNLTGFDQLDVSYQNGILYVGSTEFTASYKGDTYKVWVSAFEGGQETALTVKIPSYNKTKIASTLKAQGNIDLSFPTSSIRVTPSYKNYALTGDEEFGYSITTKSGKEEPKDQTELFNVSMADDGTITISAKDPRALNTKLKYQFSLVTMTSNLMQTKTPAIKLDIKQTAVKLKLGKSSVSINPTVLDPVNVSLTLSNNAFAMEEPIIKVMDSKGRSLAKDALKVAYADSALSVSADKNVQAGEKYKVLIQAADGQPVSTLTVSVLGGKSAAISATQKVRGSLDVIRPKSSIVVLKPTFRGFNAVSEYSQKMSVIAFDGKMELGECTDLFEIHDNGDQTFTIRSKGNVDHTLKYKLHTVVSIPAQDDKMLQVILPDVDLKITMGKASLYANVKTVTLFAKDMNSVGVVTLKSTDTSLAKIDTVRLKKSVAAEAFEITDFGGGQYAIGFRDGKTAQAKNGSLVLEIFLKGNTGAKPNATVTVKVSVLK